MLKKKFILLATVVISSLTCVNVFASEFSDVPNNHWAYSEIYKADNIGFMSGMDDHTFGLGQNVTRAQFVSMLVRMFGWEKISGSNSFNDVDNSKWYYADITTAVEHGVIKADKTNFRPTDNITREEMAVMLIRALGYDSLAEEAVKADTPFTDIVSNKGYINLAYDFGIVSGKSVTEFVPGGTALREEAAAMMIRCYDKYNSHIDFLHGFYAFSSYNQKDMAASMDAVSFGWGKMEYSDENGVVLNTTSFNENEWCVPSGYEDIVSYLKNNNVKTNLNVFLSDSESSAGSAILNSAQNRKQAVKAIIDELSVSYKQLGYNPYSGVTIDFENLRGTELKNSFVLFLKELKEELNSLNKTLYVTVQPNMKSGAYFDGYDFKEIGGVADKIILMAYDYQAKEIPQSVMESGFTTTPVTPFDEVYYALKTITNSKTGVQDKNKILLGMSMSNVGWKVTDGKITNAKGLTYSYSELLNHIETNGNVMYSEKYKNPYLIFESDAGTTTVWYEDSRSIYDKIKLAEMFGIKSVSIWRLGTIPEYNSSSNMNIWSCINDLK
ncbi:S-layer homology domain protein [anaerobic digester metagenome]